MTIDDLPPITPDPVIEAYKKGIDRTLLRENLRRTPAERCEIMMQAEALRAVFAGNRKRRVLSNAAPARRVFAALCGGGVQFVCGLNVSALSYGRADGLHVIDLVIGDAPANLRRLEAALAPLLPRAGRDGAGDVRRLTLDRDDLDLDIALRVPSGGRFAELSRADLALVPAFGFAVPVLSRDRLDRETTARNRLRFGAAFADRPSATA